MNRILLPLAVAFSGSTLLLVDSAIKGAVLLVTAAIAALTLRRHSAATRHLVWLITIVSLLVLPAMSALLPQWSVLPEWARLASKVEAVSTVTADETHQTPGTHEFQETNVSNQAITQVPEEISLPAAVPSPATVSRSSATEMPTPAITQERATTGSPEILSVVWVIGFLLLMIRLLAARLLLMRIERTAIIMPYGERKCVTSPSVSSPHSPAENTSGIQRIINTLIAAQAQLTIHRRITLLFHSQKTIPVVWGIFHHRLLLPTAALQWSEEQLRSVMLHELGHIKRRDTLAQLLAQTACALHWFNPLVWFAAWRLHVERERACDDFVLASGVRASAYAEHLLNVATRLSSSPWTQACGLAMVRSSSLHGRLTAVLSEKRNRRSASTFVVAASVLLGAIISIPVAMLGAADENQRGEEKAAPTENSSAGTATTNESRGIKLQPGMEEHLNWGDTVNGLRAAVMIRTSPQDNQPGTQPNIYLVVQNVSQKAIRFCDATGIGEISDRGADSDSVVTGTNKSEESANQRTLYIRLHGEPVAGISREESTQTDVLLQPREVACLDLFRPVSQSSDVPSTGALIAEGVIKDPSHSLSLVLNIMQAPENAWTGELAAPPTRGAFAALGPMPKSKEGQDLFRSLVDHARLNHDIPGGLVSRLHDKVQEFIRLNTGDQFGDPYAKKMQPLVARFENTGDWKQADLVALVDDIAAVSTIPLETTMEQFRERTLQRGPLLPNALEKARWGEPLPGGLRIAWMLEPQAGEYHLRSSLKSRVLIHNSGKEPVAFVTRSFHQPEHKSRKSDGAEVRIESTYWTTIGRPEAYRLHPGEYCEVYAPGIGIGPNDQDDDDWANVRPGSWILANEGDEIVFQPGAVMLTGDHNPRLNPDWWLEFIKERVAREAPLPADPKEREVILFRVVQDLFGNSPSPEEADALYADMSPEALDNFALRLSTRSWLTSVAGPIRSGDTKFRVLSEDPDAATRTRVAMNPGRYNLGEDIRLVVTRRPRGDGIVNEASITWYPKNSDSKSHIILLPDGYHTWAAAWSPGSTVLWVQQESGFRSYDFSNPEEIKEEEVVSDNVPPEIRQAFPARLATPEVPVQPKPAAATPATAGALKTETNSDGEPLSPLTRDEPLNPKHEYAQSLFRKWKTSARTDGKIPGALIGHVAKTLDDFVRQYPDNEATPKLAALRPKFDASHDWDPAAVVALLDDVTAISTAPVSWADTPMESSEVWTIQAGQPLPIELKSAAWGQPAENGLRAAWLLEPRAEQYPLGTVLKARVLFNNTGTKPIVFRTETWHQDDRHTARDANGTSIGVKSTFYTGITPMVTYRLEPGEYAEVPGHGIAIGAGDYAEERSTGSVGAWIEANEGDLVWFSSTVDASRQGWTGPDDPKDPLELWKLVVRQRVEREAPIPSTAADREQLIRRVMQGLFGEKPTSEELSLFLADTAPDALEKLLTRLQARPRIEPFVGKLPTGETSFRVIAADPNAAKAPRTANSPGRYVLGDTAHLLVWQLTEGDRRTNKARIAFLSPDPKVASPHEPYEFELPAGIGTYGIVWDRGAGELWILEKDLVRKYEFANPSQVQEMRLVPGNIMNIPAHMHEPLKKAFDVPGAAVQQQLPPNPPEPAAASEIRVLIPERTFETVAGSDALQVAWDDLDLLKVLNAKSVPVNVVEHFPEWLQSLDGKRIRIRGFMYPTFEAFGLREFTLARKLNIMNFVAHQPTYELIGVTLSDGETTDYIEGRPFDVEGTFRIQPKADGNELIGLYRLENASIIPSQATRPSERETTRPVENQPAQEYAMVEIRGDGTIFRRDQLVTLDELKEEAARHQNWNIVIRADEQVQYSRVVGVMDALKTAGVENFSFEAAQVGDGKYRVANRTGDYNLGGGRKLYLCRPGKERHWFTVIWTEAGPWPRSRLVIHPYVNEEAKEKWAVVWEPGAELLWWMDDSVVGKMRLTNPAEVLVTREGRRNSFSRDFELPEEVTAEFLRLGFEVGRDQTLEQELLPGGNTSSEEMLTAETQEQWTVEGTVTDADGQPLADVPIRVRTEYHPTIDVVTTKTNAQGNYRAAFRLDFRTLAQFRGISVEPVLDGFTERDLSQAGVFDALLRAGEDPQRVILRDYPEKWLVGAIAGDDAVGPIPRFSDRQLIIEQPARADFALLPASEISGEIVDTQGHPLSPQFIAVTASGQRPGYSVAYATSDDDGQFHLKGIPSAMPLSFTSNPAGKPGETSRSTSEEFGPAGTFKIRLVAPEGGHGPLRIERVVVN